MLDYQAIIKSDTATRLLNVFTFEYKQRDESRNPIFDVSVNYLHKPTAIENNGLRVSLYSPLQKMSHDFGIVMRRGEDDLKITLQYSDELFEDKVAENFLS